MEVYAGYSENADHNVGRVIDAIEELGELDNTLILWIWGDNGASMEGTITGSFNELTMQNGIPLTDEMQLQLAERYGGLDAVGRRDHGPALRRGVGVGRQHAVPVGQAGRLAPRRHPQPDGRALARSHHRRRRAALAVHARHRRRARRSSTSPGSRRPTTVDGIEQEPMHGATFAASLTDADAPEHRTQQYFETIGNRGMYKDGWWLAMKTERIPWVLTPEALAAVRARASGTRTRTRPSCTTCPTTSRQAHDLAAEHPEKVAGAQGRCSGRRPSSTRCCRCSAPLSTFFGIAAADPGARPRSSSAATSQNVMPGMIPRIYNRSYAITADLVVPDGGAEGVIVAEADHLGGFTLYVKDGKLTHTYSMMGVFVFTAGRRGGPPDRRGDRAHGVRGRRRRRRPPAARSRCSSTTDPSARDGWTTPCRSGSPATPGWTSAATTAASSTSPTRTRSRSRSPARSRRSSFDIKPHLSDQDELDLHAAAHHGHAAHALSG